MAEEQFRVLVCERCGCRYTVNIMPKDFTSVYVWRFCPKCMREVFKNAVLVKRGPMRAHVKK
jgi:hydrogenase maturation factor HypF (carbamoyltransferase family)